MFATVFACQGKSRDAAVCQRLLLDLMCSYSSMKRWQCRPGLHVCCRGLILFTILQGTSHSNHVLQEGNKPNFELTQWQMLLSPPHFLFIYRFIWHIKNTVHHIDIPKHESMLKRLCFCCRTFFVCRISQKSADLHKHFTSCGTELDLTEFWRG